MRISTQNLTWPAAFNTAWLPYLLIATCITLLAALYLFPTAWEFPMDDTYIHFVYAQNLAEHGQLMFNQAGEVGVGSTSLTWVLLLAGAYRLGIPLHLAAKIFGLLALVGTAWGLYDLLHPVLRRGLALSLALLAGASGHLLWFALSGMETVLFLCLGIQALLLYRNRRWVALGFTLGLLALTRPDGLALAAATALVEGWKHRRDLRRLPPGLLAAGLVCLFVCGPWFGYLLARTGHILPTSAVGKQTSSLIGIRLIVSRSPSLAFLTSFPALVYVGAWAGYLMAFVLGGMALPGPALSTGGQAGGVPYAISWLGILGWVGVIAPLFYSFTRWALDFYRSSRAREERYLPLVVFTVWIILHNLAYALFLPIPGTASRYGAINHIALWLALLLGLLRIYRRRQASPTLKHGQAGLLLAAGLALIALANTLYWNRVYDANLEHMLNVRIAAARYVAEQIPAGEPIAVFDVGAMRYFSGRPVIDLGGLIDPELGKVYRSDGKIDRYLARRGARYVILPGRANAAGEGWFDFAREMGLTSSPLFSLEQVRVFEIAYERWLLGYLPTNNYQATVTIYRLVR